MKTCVKCGKTFNGANMMFCPSDGGQLVNAQTDSAPVDPQPLTSFASTAPPPSPPQDRYQQEYEYEMRPAPPRQNNKRNSKFGGDKAVLAIAGIVAVGLVGWFVYAFGFSAGGKDEKSKEPLKAAGSTPGEVMKNSMGMEFAWIPAGQFLMGSPPSESFRNNSEGPQRQVSIREGFWLGRFEVTQAQWREVMGNSPSGFPRCGDDCPVESVSWNEVKAFLAKLNDEGDGYVYSLPTEAEWEYAARAGTTSEFAFGATISSSQANFDGKSPYGRAPKGSNLEKTTKVGSYQANAWGLHDMHGNVWEWVEDVHNTKGYEGLPVDGTANDKVGDMSSAVVRGGGYLNPGSSLRSAMRTGAEVTVRTNLIGFRVVARRKL